MIGGFADTQERSDRGRARYLFFEYCRERKITSKGAGTMEERRERDVATNEGERRKKGRRDEDVESVQQQVQ
jgi:hypothetical protein